MSQGRLVGIWARGEKTQIAVGELLIGEKCAPRAVFQMKGSLWAHEGSLPLAYRAKVPSTAGFFVCPSQRSLCL